MITRSSTTRSVLALPVLGLALVVGACAPTTNLPYNASDGVRAEVGNVSVDNLMIVTTGEGDPGQLLGAATNASDDLGTLSIRTGDGSVDIPVMLKGGETMTFHKDGATPTVIAAVPTEPGTNLLVTLTSGDGTETTTAVPVLDGTLPEYADALPDGS